MSNTPNAPKVHPKVKVTSPVEKTAAFTTHGGTQRSEAHYQKIVDRAVNHSDKRQGRR